MKPLAKLLLAQSDELPRIGRHVLRPRRQGRVFQRGREPLVPRTDVLADVASIYELAHQRTQLRRDGRAMLDGEVRDAARGVEHAWLDERVRRAGVQASRARAAAVGLERRVGFERDVDEEDAEKKERAFIRVDEVGVLADPAESG